MNLNLDLAELNLVIPAFVPMTADGWPGCMLLVFGHGSVDLRFAKHIQTASAGLDASKNSKCENGRVNNSVGDFGGIFYQFAFYLPHRIFIPSTEQDTNLQLNTGLGKLKTILQQR